VADDCEALLQIEEAVSKTPGRTRILTVTQATAIEELATALGVEPWELLKGI
jgi:hypothetical protein